MLEMRGERKLPISLAFLLRYPHQDATREIARRTLEFSSLYYIGIFDTKKNAGRKIRTLVGTKPTDLESVPFDRSGIPASLWGAFESPNSESQSTGITKGVP